MASFVNGTDTLVHQFFSFTDDNFGVTRTEEVIETIGTINSSFDVTRKHICLFDLPGSRFCSFMDLAGQVEFRDSDCYALPTVDTDDIYKGDFQLMPNPVSDRIEIRGIEFTQASVYNLQGQQLVAYKATDIIDVSFLPTGTYLCVVELASGKKRG